MSDEIQPYLFAAETIASDSPRLAWLKKHNLQTHEDKRIASGETVTNEHGDEYHRWSCFGCVPGRKKYGSGNTEGEAILDYCHQTGTVHWTLES